MTASQKITRTITSGITLTLKHGYDSAVAERT